MSRRESHSATLEATPSSAEFNLTDASKITGNTVASLRTRIARGLLNHVGDRPLAGDERRFPRTGIYEIALIDQLERGGLTQAKASAVVDEYMKSVVFTADTPPRRGKQAIILFTIAEDIPLGLDIIALGWKAVSGAAIQLQLAAKHYRSLTPAKQKKFMADWQAGEPCLNETDTDVEDELPHIQTLNVDAVIARIDAAIDSYLAGQDSSR